jgi:hypothetical protein
LIGAIWFFVDMGLLIPWFRDRFAVFPTDFQHFAPFTNLGTTPGTIALNVMIHPMNTILIALQPGKLEYLLALIAPYLFLGLLGSFIWISALPELAITLLSNHPNMDSVLLRGGRFSMVTATSLALSAVFTIQRIKSLGYGERKGFQLLIASCIFFSTLSLTPLWLNSTALTSITGADELHAILDRVGPNAAIAVPYDVVAPFAQRAIVFDIDRNPPQVVFACAEYVVIQHVHSQPQVFGLLSANAFRIAWEGEEFELWQAPVVPNCLPSKRPWE